MDEERRTRLSERRRLAQLRRERAAVSATFRRVGRSLCERQVRFTKLVPERCREALGPLASGPGRDERLLWAPIPNGTCAGWESEAERDFLLGQALAACTDPAAKAAVIWHPFEAGLSLASADLAAHADLILAESADTIWIVAASGGPWLIELAYWDRELCWTPRMPVFVG